MRLTFETIKKPLRMVKHRLMQQRHHAGTQPVTSIIDVYSQSYPTSQEALNIFQGEWSSLFPAEMNLQAGTVPLFEDDRIQMGLRELGGVAGQTVLELGPLEGGHSYQLEKAGAKSVLAIEANTRAYLKCLIAKELLGMQRVRFLCGDFMEYLRQSPPRFDFVLCSGVLYHTPDPFRLLTRLRAICKETLILNTQSIPEMHGVRNAAVFYPFLPEEQRRIWDRGVGNQKAIRGPYEPESGYGNWFWGMTPSSIESMLRCAGFEVQERFVSPFSCTFVCGAVPTQFVAESGPWPVSENKDLASRR